VCDLGAAEPRHVDHDHRSGQVRGILCFTCNGGLGLFRDSERYPSRAIGYLRDTSYQAVLVEPGVWRILPRRRRPMSSSTL
jgi:Recombination endonuclease VII